jgi:hypothetical protein
MSLVNTLFGEPIMGEYVTFEKIKEANFQAIKDLYGQIGFKLMLNEHTYIQKCNPLIGVEIGA